jgi:hypothetical protein
MPISVEERGKIQLETDQERVGNPTLFSHCSLLINPSKTPTGVLKHCEGETNC